MPDEDRQTRTQVQIGPQLVAYVMGELDPDAQQWIEAQVREQPSLVDEIEDIRSHLKLHQGMRKVAPRRGSFERLQRRLKDEGALQGAIPGVHRMLRRAFVISFLAGLLFVALLAVFAGTSKPPTLIKVNVIGQIIYRAPAIDFTSERGDEINSGDLVQGEVKNTGSYDATLWVPTGMSNSYTTIEVVANTEFKFDSAREMTVNRGVLRQAEIEPGGLGDQKFTIKTPHCSIIVDNAALSVIVLDAETQVTVASGTATLRGRDVSCIVGPGYCSSVARDAEPLPPKPVLELNLYQSGRRLVEVTLRNVGYVPAKIKRALTSRPIYLMTVSRTPDYTEKQPSGSVSPPQQVIPKRDPATPLAEHQGETWLKPGDAYTFTVDATPMLTADVDYWVTMKYQGGLYGPQGFARIEVGSGALKISK
ncbi:MAG: hypothetical protein IT462_11375 [Planctomycetes bacterium]|nr:hypothetical protein [Planctomycetota bacterium]